MHRGRLFTSESHPEVSRLTSERRSMPRLASEAEEQLRGRSDLD